MLGTAATHHVPDTPNSTHTTVCAKLWASCCIAVRTGVQQALTLQRYYGLVPPRAWGPQPHSRMVMLMESDVSVYSRSLGL